MGEEVGNFVPTVFRETAKIRRLWPGVLSTELKKNTHLRKWSNSSLGSHFLFTLPHTVYSPSLNLSERRKKSIYSYINQKFDLHHLQVKPYPCEKQSEIEELTKLTLIKLQSQQNIK